MPVHIHVHTCTHTHTCRFTHISWTEELDKLQQITTKETSREVQVKELFS
jgi:hypothetical protein